MPVAERTLRTSLLSGTWGTSRLQDIWDAASWDALHDTEGVPSCMILRAPLVEEWYKGGHGCKTLRESLVAG
jgi:hypothetical protein